METNTVQPIALDALRVSPLNARRVVGDEVDALAASIRAEGLLQNLTVVGPADDGRFEIVCGSRRFAALQQLRDRNELPAGLSRVPCLVVDMERAASASLAENTMRAAMHPADQFEAFKRLVAERKSIEDIAHEFGTVPIAIHRHLKLANVAPSLFAKFRNDEISLEQMHALAITDDHKAQEAAWNVRDEWKRNPNELRARLTKSEIRVSSDAAASFVGLAALRAAGMEIRGDLFSANEDGYVSAKERSRIDELALGKLEALLPEIRAEGWSWAEARIEFAYQDRYKFEQVHPEGNKSTLSTAEREEFKTLQARAAVLCGKQCNAAEEAEYDAAHARLQVLAGKLNPYSPEQYAAGGVVVFLERSGLQIMRGLLKPGQRKPKANKKADKKNGAGKDKASADEAPTLSAPMLSRLRAQRTSILQRVLLDHPAVALATLAESLIIGFRTEAFEHMASGSVSAIRFGRETDERLVSSAPEIIGMAHFVDARQRIGELLAGVPVKEDALLPWLLEQPGDRVVAIIAGLAAMSAASSLAYVEPNNDMPSAKGSPLGLIYAATLLDPAQHWSPTRETFLAHVPRAVTLAAVEEACGADQAAKLQSMKKDALAEAAELQLQGKGWLPEILRGPATTAIAAGKAPAKKPASKAAAKSKEKAKPAAKPKAATTKARKPAKPAPKAPARKAARKAGNK